MAAVLVFPGEVRVVPRVKVVFTFVALFHVRSQQHIVRAGTCILRRMWRDLRCRKTKVFTTSIRYKTELTRVWSYMSKRK